MINDERTDELISRLKDVIDEHFTKFEDEDYKDMITSTLVALAIHLGNLKWYCVKTDEVAEINFNEVLWGIIENTCDELRAKESAQH